MGKTFSVDPQVLDEAVVRLEEISRSYTDISKQLMEKAESMGAAWDAADNLAYVAQIQGLTDDLNNMAAKIQKVSEALGQQSANYKQHCEDNISQVKKLAN